MENEEFENRLKQALSLELPYSERLLRPGELRASVMAIFGYARVPRPENPSGISLLVTRRADTVQSHQGQMAFPGGRCEPDEIARADFLSTALRETNEEVGIPAERIRVLGSLPELTTVTQYRVTPYIGILKTSQEETVLRTDPAEVAEAIWVPWSVLVDPATYGREMIQRGNVRFPTHVYTVDGHRIWGATGAMVKNLLDRFERIG